MDLHCQYLPWIIGMAKFLVKRFSNQYSFGLSNYNRSFSENLIFGHILLFFSIAVLAIFLLTRELFIEQVINANIPPNQEIDQDEGENNNPEEIPVGMAEVPIIDEDIDAALQRPDQQQENVPEIILAEVFGIAGNPMTGTLFFNNIEAKL